MRLGPEVSMRAKPTRHGPKVSMRGVNSGLDLEVSMPRILLMLGAFLAAVFGAYASDGGRAFEIADYYRIAFPSAPSLSPDGTRIAVSVRHFDLEGGKSRSVLWMMDAHGSRPRQMTFGSHHDTNPVFSPDGRHLLFVSDRDGDTDQLYLIPVDGGEARRLTDFPMGVSAPVWSPDGRWIAATSAVYPECGADADCNRTILEARSDGPLSAFMSDELLYRHWNEWREGRYPHILLVDSSTGKVERDLTPGRWDSPTFSLGGDIGYAFSPDGSQLCTSPQRTVAGTAIPISRPMAAISRFEASRRRATSRTCSASLCTTSGSEACVT
jgi:Tol biopolymer transport system component